MQHIIHKHDSYVIIQPNAVGVKHFMKYTNGDLLKGAYPIVDKVIPKVPGYEEVELQVLFDNFNKSRGR